MPEEKQFSGQTGGAKVGMMEDTQNRHRAFGALARYANPELIDKEKGAWTPAAPC
ncbi:hypothetical protein FACS1894158_12520 [Betaproteobacteria bacterium]|nr:hypothetical protein FACS1894158_12520 [Betaproteobacteria bacterium]